MLVTVNQATPPSTTTTTPAGPTTTTTQPPLPAPTTPPGQSPPAPEPDPEPQSAAELGPPKPQAASRNIFSDTEGEQVAVVIQARKGNRAAGTPVQVSAVGLVPGSTVIITIFSDPRELGRGVVDENGNFEATVVLPELEAGRHTVLVESVGKSGAIQVAGAFVLDEDGTIERLVQPSIITNFAGPDDPRLTRALKNGRSVWDVAARPLTTAAIMIAAVGLLAFAGAGGLSGTSATAAAGGLATSRGLAAAGAAAAAAAASAGESRKRSRGKLANTVTKKLKGINITSDARGDLSRTWALPGTSATDSFSRTSPVTVGPWSKILPRLIVDGAWARAMFGSLGFALWPLAVGVAISATIVDGSTPVVPAFGILLALVVIGILDAGAGAVGWLTLTVIAATTGKITEWADVRTLLGMGVLFATLSLMAHAIRPLRRYVATNSFERWERVFDYVMMPVFVAFAAGAFLKALNGLSGLQIVDAIQIADLRWAAFAAILVRLAFEDIASHLYPERMKMVQPKKLVDQTRPAGAVALIVRSILFLFIAEPFFGVTATTIIAAIMLAIPVALKFWEDELPNSVWINRWFPRGALRFCLLLFLGLYLTSVLIGPDGGEAALKASFLWLLIPGVAEGVIELFGRHGGNWPKIWLKRTLGACIWLTSVSIVTGVFTPFI